MFFTGTLWEATRNLILQMRKLGKFKESVRVQGALLGSEIGSVWLPKPHISVSDCPTTTSLALLAHSHVPVGWAFYKYLPEKHLHPTQLPDSVCSHPGWLLAGFCMHFRFGRMGRKSEALGPKCLQKWALRPRLSHQFLVATSVYLRKSHFHPRAVGDLFRVGKGVEVQGLPSFLSSKWPNWEIFADNISWR